VAAVAAAKAAAPKPARPAKKARRAIPRGKQKVPTFKLSTAKMALLKARTVGK